MEFKTLYDGYKVSSCGIVLGKRGKPMSPTLNDKGYPVLSVYIDGKHTTKAVHRMVAEAWLPNPLGLAEVNHIDCNRENPDLSNLEWCTHSYNIEYSYRMTNRSATGESNARCLTTEATVREICVLLAAGNSAASVRDLGYGYGLVRAIKAGRNWSHISNEYF